jgi:hypothetical protein
MLAYISLAPGETGAIQVQFLASAIAGDNYRLKAQAMSVSTASRVLKEATSGLLEVFKEIKFERVVQMTGGADVNIIMAAGRVAPAFADANTLYPDPVAARVLPPGPQSPDFLHPIQPPNPGELPTQQELDQFASPDPILKAVAKGVISGKALAWARRVTARILLFDDLEMGRKQDLVGMSDAFGVIGIRAFSEKEDGDPATGQTNFYPPGITIPVGPFGANGLRQEVDPDGDWDPIRGIEKSGRIWIPARGLEPAMEIVIARRLAALFSDHIPFGEDGETTDTGIMSDNPKPTDTTFTDENILRLRGWTP